MKPHWIDAPEWANWLAQDDDGDWYWFQDKPEPINAKEWLTFTGGNFEWARSTPVNQPWQRTLEPRP